MSWLVLNNHAGPVALSLLLAKTAGVANAFALTSAVTAITRGGGGMPKSVTTQRLLDATVTAGANATTVSAYEIMLLAKKA